MMWNYTGGHPPDIAQLTVEEFLNNDDGTAPQLKRYMLTFMPCTFDDLCGMIAETIADCGSIGIPLTDMHGFVFLNSILHLAVHAEMGIGILPLDDGPGPADWPHLLFYSAHNGGGVEVGINDEAWDPSMWVLRFLPFNGAA